MHKRIRKLKQAIRMMGGVDIVISHTPPKGVGDMDDQFHRGFESFLEVIDTYHPKYWLHGHIHLRYGQDITRIREYNGTQVINCCEKYELDYDLPSEVRQLNTIQRLYIRFFMKNLEIIDY